MINLPLVTIRQTNDKLHVKVESPEKAHLSEVKERIIFDLKFDIEAIL